MNQGSRSTSIGFNTSDEYDLRLGAPHRRTRESTTAFDAALPPVRRRADQQAQPRRAAGAARRRCHAGLTTPLVAGALHAGPPHDRRLSRSEIDVATTGRTRSTTGSCSSTCRCSIAMHLQQEPALRRGAALVPLHLRPDQQRHDGRRRRSASGSSCAFRQETDAGVDRRDAASEARRASRRPRAEADAREVRSRRTRRSRQAVPAARRSRATRHSPTSTTS